MTGKKIQYLNRLETCLKNKRIPEAKEIVFEYQLHIDDKVYELMLNGMNADESLEYVLGQMVPPQDIADMYQQEKQRQVPSFFLAVVNILILLAGLLITVFHTNGNIPGIHYAWELLISHKWLLLISYSFLWAATGFFYGQHNGYYQKTKLYRYTLLAVLPNYIFMFFVLIGFKYGWKMQWFAFLLDSFAFFLACITLTAAYYPIVQLGHRLGVLQGI